MTHNILVKHGWQMVYSTKKFTAYENDGKLWVLWASGKSEVYSVD